jgi:hypothetical protein
MLVVTSWEGGERLKVTLEDILQKDKVILVEQKVNP